MTRDWKEYNEELVKRGEFYLSPDFLSSQQSWQRKPSVTSVSPPPGIKLRKDTKLGLSPRGKAAKEFQELEYEEWKKKHEYGK